MEIRVDSAGATLSVAGRTVFFCSPGCAELYAADPNAYRAASGGHRRSVELVIVGGGPAGLTAALYASIQRLRTVLLADDIGGQAVESVEMRNYMGFQVIEGNDLISRFREQLLLSNFVEHRLTRGTSLRSIPRGFAVETEGAETYEASAVLLATGMRNRRLGVPGEERLLHRGVSFSVVQDAGRFHGRDVAVIGGGNSALQAAHRLAETARSVHLIAVRALSGDAVDIAQARDHAKVSVLENTTVHEILGRERVESIRVGPTGERPERRLPVSGVFVEIGFVPQSELAGTLVDRNERGEIIVGRDCSTRAPGLYAAGDVTDSYGKRVIISCGEGARAALAAERYLGRLRDARTE